MGVCDTLQSNDQSSLAFSRRAAGVETHSIWSVIKIPDEFCQIQFIDFQLCHIKSCTKWQHVSGSRPCYCYHKCSRLAWPGVLTFISIVTTRMGNQHKVHAGKYWLCPVRLIFRQTFWHMSSLCLAASMESHSEVKRTQKSNRNVPLVWVQPGTFVARHPCSFPVSSLVST